MRTDRSDRYAWVQLGVSRQRPIVCADVSYINVTDVIKEITPSHLNIEPVFSDNVATDYF